MSRKRKDRDRKGEPPERAESSERGDPFEGAPEPSGEEIEDRDSERLVARFKATGDEAAFAKLYTRYFDRVYAYVRVALDDHHEAEDAAQEVFTRAFQALPAYELRGIPFRAWLFKIVRNYALDWLKKHGRVEPMDPAEIDKLREQQEISEAELQALTWISDRDLLVFVERLSLPQRQVLVMRNVLGLGTDQIAASLGRTEADVRMLQSRALKFLRDRLEAIGREPSRHDPPSGLTRCNNPAHVLRSRRFSL